MDSHTDSFKKEIFFREGDIILDPFCGSGTTLVQANELKINAIGVDVSEFNTLISNCKINKFDLFDVKKEIDYLTIELKKYLIDSNTVNFEEELSKLLNVFNNEYFPSPEYKYKL